MSKMKITLKANAPDVLRVQLGMEFDRTFKKKDAPFLVDRNIGEGILRSYDDFQEYVEPKAKAKAETSTATPKAKKAAGVKTTAKTAKKEEKTDVKTEDVPTDAVPPATEDSLNRVAADEVKTEDAESK